MKIPFLDLRVTDKFEFDSIISSISKVLNHGQMVMGPEIQILENEISKYCFRKFCVSVGSGTDALYLSLRALDIGTGDEVITTSLSWIATANAIALTGAKPIFADINDDLNISSLSVESLITKKTKAILVVNYTGKVADMDQLAAIAKKNDIYLIEDGSQSFGAKYKERPSGSFGILSAISHNPMKVFGAIGEAGSILCDDVNLYNRLVSLRYNGTINRETCIEPSLNGRMDTVQAAILIEKLKTLQNIIEKRQNNANYYNKHLSDIIIKPVQKIYENDTYYTYTIKYEKRNELKTFLENNGVETKIQHLLLMPEQPAYKDKAIGDFKNAKKIVNNVLCLPVYEKLTETELEFICKLINSFVDQNN
jgi:dTDP-4-amino-4,6-dideoxygalactose transaminase